MKKTQIIAHRGFWKTIPETSENSVQSLKNGQKFHVYGSEFDVQMTKDVKLIVLLEW
ncbi:glycerophosphodiester phosphodiesterase family protein [Chryseobacterium sp. TY4]